MPKFRLAKTLHILIYFLIGAKGYTPGSFSIPSSASISKPDQNYTSDLVWELSTTQNVSFQTSCDTFDLDYWQQAINGQGSSTLTNLLSNESSDGSPYTYSWIVSSSGYDLTVSPVFFFRVYCHDTSNFFPKPLLQHH